MNEETVPCEGGCGATCRPFRKRKTRLCVNCVRKANGRHPSKIRLTRDAMKRRMADPVMKAEHLGRAHDGLRKRYAQDPEFARRMADNCRKIGLSQMGHAAQPRGSEPRRRAVASRRATLLGWRPPEYLPEYERLVYSKRLRAADARAAIERQIAADLSKLSPHERQLRQIANGARLVPTFKPRATDEAFTLGGVATGMI